MIEVMHTGFVSPATNRSGLSGNRRDPAQSRSVVTVTRVRSACSRLLGRGVLLDHLTVARIAAEADLSVGAVYRYFQDKETLAAEIALGHLAAFDAGIERDFGASVLTANGPALVSRLVNAFAAFLEAHPDLRNLLYGGRRPMGLDRAIRKTGHGTGATALIRRLLTQGQGLVETPEVNLRLIMSLETADRLIGFALQHHDARRRDVILDELKRLLSGYLFG